MTRSRAYEPERPSVPASVASRAAVLTASRRLELGTVELAPPAPDQIRVSVLACGICASNLSLWARGPTGATPPPGASGHEVAATVEAVGSGVSHIAPGDRVCIEPNLAVACGSCPPCRSGRALHCQNPATLPTWGFADRMTVRAAGAIKLPARLDPLRGTLVEPLACAVHALRMSEAAGYGVALSSPVRVAVIGAGALGILAAFTARRFGAREVAVVARYPHQAGVAEQVGATSVVDVDGLTRLRPDIVVVAAGGSGSQLSTAVDAVAPGGEILVLGMLAAPQPFNLRRAGFREVRITFAMSYGSARRRSDFDIAVDLVSKSAELAALITDRKPLAAINEAFAVAADRGAGAIRVVVEPEGGGAPVSYGR
jgi:2-desacetyl-2-hydroxyethyl bacteriochlorophyllide A dehydrogenase